MASDVSIILLVVVLPTLVLLAVLLGQVRFP